MQIYLFLGKNEKAYLPIMNTQGTLPISGTLFLQSEIVLVTIV
jgi:hypothetical protein